MNFLARSLGLLWQDGSSDGGGAAAAGAGIGMLVYLAILVVVVIGLWKVFEKAGHPGWAAIVPIYNLYILLKIAGRPGWWVILLFIPLINFIILILIPFDIAKKFGKGIGFALGLLFLGFIFYPLLGFGDARYQG